ncbi:MAG: oxidoreductase FAD/NAD(P)-binding domain containing protein [Parcubacteria group bacterium Gr01-1014_30]|nr:MAG: oxidoreductase FAD/NAD(P)-binding domain containing protein [Parcubacteria group bacterium Gr01-1014_30]
MTFQANSAILDRKKVAQDAMEVSFRRSPDFNFEAGQYSQIIIPELLYSDPRGNSRLFSISSSSNDKERLCIVFRESRSGYKRTLIESSLGHEIVIKGPFGKDFFLPKGLSRPVVFVAGGIGITPFLSLTNFAIEEKLALQITLLYANKSKDSAVYLDELNKMAERNRNFVLKSKLGLIDEEFLKSGVNNLKDVNWYVAGPPGMVEKTLILLSDLGVDKDNIRKERFTGY